MHTGRNKRSFLKRRIGREVLVMRKRSLLLFTLLAVLFFTTGLAASTLIRQTEVKYKIYNPDLKITADPPDLKLVWPGDKKDIKLIVDNVGDAPLKVKLQAEYDDEVAKVKFDDNNFVIEPGGEKVIGVVVAFKDDAKPGADGTVTFVAYAERP